MCGLLVCACHPWREIVDFEWPQPRHPVGSFGPQEAALLVGCADRTSPMPRMPPKPPTRQRLTSVESHLLPFGGGSGGCYERSGGHYRGVGCAVCWCVHAIPGAGLLTSIGPSPDILSGRSVLKKLRFLSAAPTGPHPCLACRQNRPPDSGSHRWSPTYCLSAAVRGDVMSGRAVISGGLGVRSVGVCMPSLARDC